MKKKILEKAFPLQHRKELLNRRTKEGIITLTVITEHTLEHCT
jgi:hypothetical protein